MIAESSEMLRMLPGKGKGRLKANAESGADLAKRAQGGRFKRNLPLFNRKVVDGMVQLFDVILGPLEETLKGAYSGNNDSSIAFESCDPAAIVRHRIEISHGISGA